MTWDWDKLKQQQRRPSGGGPAPPQMDEILNRLKKIKLPGGGLLIVIAVILILLGSTTFYTIGVDEVGVVQRFGKYVRTTQPGLNFKLPTGIEKVTKVKIRRVFKEGFGIHPATATSGAYRNESEQSASLMLTGDLNVAVVPWIVQYRINDPYKYLFKVRNVRKLLRDMSEAAVRLVVGDRSINEVISKREAIAVESRKVLQQEMNNADSGIHIITIEMKKTNVPGPVQPSFNEVNQAIQEKEQIIYNAKRDYNQAIPAAKGKAERTIKMAEGYAISQVNRAEGDAARFTSLYAAYAKAKDVTKRRLYLEMIQNVLPRMGPKYIVDANTKNVLPLLNLGKGGSVTK